MSYTVKKLAKLSGVSVRTLHFYDEIGLLKPANYGENGYRHYEEEQLLLLQQILFFRELGIQLSEIQKIISDKDFDKEEALKSHRKILTQKIRKTTQLIQTIDKTLRALNGEKSMKNDEIYKGFDKEKQEGYEQYLIESGKVKADQLETVKKKTAKWKKADYDIVNNEYDAIHRSLTETIKNKEKTSSASVQKIIRKHFEVVKKFYTPTKEGYVGLSEMYLEHQDFVKLYESYHPKLARFLSEAMKVFAKNELS